MQWYDEIKDYSYSKATFIPGTGHFTQVVWKDSKEVGFGVAQASDGSFYAVANYFPAGNWSGEFNTPDASENNDTTRSRLKKFNLDSPKLNENPLSFGRLDTDSSSNKFITEALEAHNDCRSKHGSPNLVHNQELSRIAQSWANSIAARGSMQHSKNEYKNDQLGENIAMWFQTGATYYDGKYYLGL